jgi:Serine carboxypeptidase
MKPRVLLIRLLSVLLFGAACGSPAPATKARTSSPPKPVSLEAGFLEVPARSVTVKGQPVSIEATGRLFYNLRPADEEPENKPIFILFNGFADDVVRPYGTGPMTVAEGGAVVENPASLTSLANLVYVEPRQAGYSYDIVTGRAPTSADCSLSVFNEYVDAADVLLAVLAFLDGHPNLTGPVYWFGESYAGVRITWILTYLRGAWANVPYEDALLAQRIAAEHRAGSLRAGQILLEAWLAGGAEPAAIQAVCNDPNEIASVAASLGVGCEGLDACTCTTNNGRSLYNYAYTEAHQTLRETEGDAAHIDPKLAAELLGTKLTDIRLLAASERSKGFKCSTPNDTVPDEAALASLLGALPAGQSYFLPYSPLPETGSTDWSTLDDEAKAFAQNLHDVPAFLTKGDHDLVVPTLALAPALRSVLGTDRVDTRSPSRLGITYADGEHYIDLFDYPTAGHMVTMLEPERLASDLAGWLSNTKK